ncbi:MAG: pyruvate carboxylase [Piptocephalis tieghemiana]|nr:MAG: pyruvate carboxylase [Piptocephalis tieghemiana]
MPVTVEAIRRRSTSLTGTLEGVQKIMAANRGEIATRVFRTAHELHLRTVAIFSHEDRLSLHRGKADEAYMISPPGKHTPVGTYLAQDDIIDIAIRRRVDMIHPGYGFLSENSEFARKVEDAGLIFVGPRPETIDRLGDKTQARQLAIECNVPVVPGTDGPVNSFSEVKAFCDLHGYPAIIKAAMGGGGRGMRVVRSEQDLEEGFSRAQSEALSAFGDGTVFVERFLDRPRHIEVQIIGDGTGDVVHLFERDCSVQRRHQKVVEVAPAKDITPELREALLKDAVKIAQHVKYRNAGTVEFLVDVNKGEHYFIEINPRIQVEHTITEEITGIDIVAAQIQIAAGMKLSQLGLYQDRIKYSGFAIQCRITTEDPAAGFQPDTGKIEVYRSAGGPGVRLDGASGFAGSVISPHYDSLLVKMTCRAPTYETACLRVMRALIEFRIRGVKTNIPFLATLLTHPTFQAGKCWTTFVDDTPELFRLVHSQNRAQKLLTYLADMVVNGTQIEGQQGQPILRQTPTIPVLPVLEHLNGGSGACAAGTYSLGDGLVDTSQPCREGWRAILLSEGPEGFAKAVRQHRGALIMDTTWRDAHQSLLATRVRTTDLAAIAPLTSHALKGAFALEMWGGATFDVAMRFLHEDPWERLAKLRKLVPNIPFQMLLRGANAVGYTSYPDNVVVEFCRKAKAWGIDIFRVFDSLNYVENLRFGIQAVREAGGVVEGTICYTGDVSNPSKNKKYNLEYYIDLVDRLVSMGIHILGIKDMAGLLKPRAATILVSAIRSKFPDLPIHLHTHDTAGTGVASMLSGIEAGADVVDVAVDSMSGLTSQPSMGALIGALSVPHHTDSVKEEEYQGPGIPFPYVSILNQYWEQVRLMYSCFDPGLKSGDSGVYEHEMPGGQYTNLLFQATSLGLGSRWAEVKRAYSEANLLCGDIVKVTPSSKVVGDLAQFMVSSGITKGSEVIERAEELSFPTSVVEYFQGMLGQPHGGFPEPLRSKILRENSGLERIDHRPGSSLPPLDLAALRTELAEVWGQRHIRDVDVLSAALYPKVFADYMSFLQRYGDLSVVPTPNLLSKPVEGEEFTVEIEEGKVLIIKFIALGGSTGADGRRDAFFELNGEPRVVCVLDRTAAPDTQARVKANSSKPGQVGAPMGGVVVEVKGKVGDRVEKGQALCVLSAMKMETVVGATISGTIVETTVQESESVGAGDLLFILSDEENPEEEKDKE